MLDSYTSACLPIRRHDVRWLERRVTMTSEDWADVLLWRQRIVQTCYHDVRGLERRVTMTLQDWTDVLLWRQIIGETCYHDIVCFFRGIPGRLGCRVLERRHHLCTRTVQYFDYDTGNEAFTLPDTDGVFTLAWSGTGKGTGTDIMWSLSHCTGTWKNGLYGLYKKLSHCTWTGTGKNTNIHHREHFQDLKNGCQTQYSGPENVSCVLPCPCSGAVWKALIKTIQPILPCPGPGSGPS